MNLFDRMESERRKEVGMAIAAAARPQILAEAREIARRLAVLNGFVHMDMVAEVLADRGHDPLALGPAAGSVFKGKEWEFAGQFIKSERISNHSRLLRVWRLREAT